MYSYAQTSYRLFNHFYDLHMHVFTCSSYEPSLCPTIFICFYIVNRKASKAHKEIANIYSVTSSSMMLCAVVIWKTISLGIGFTFMINMAIRIGRGPVTSVDETCHSSFPIKIVQKCSRGCQWPVSRMLARLELPVLALC